MSLTKQQIIAQIATWNNRATMAEKQGNSVLQSEALKYVEKYQFLLNELDEIDVGDSNDDPDNYCRVPRKPKPHAGAGSIALPLPKPDKNDLDD